MKKQIIIASLILGLGTTSLMAKGEGSFMKCVDKAETKAEFQECKKNLKSKMGGKSIEEMKTHILEKISKREKGLNAAKECVKKAQTKKELKECRPKHKGKHKNKK